MLLFPDSQPRALGYKISNIFAKFPLIIAEQLKSNWLDIKSCRKNEIRSSVLIHTSYFCNCKKEKDPLIYEWNDEVVGLTPDTAVHWWNVRGEP